MNDISKIVTDKDEKRIRKIGPKKGYQFYFTTSFQSLRPFEKEDNVNFNSFRITNGYRFNSFWYVGFTTGLDYIITTYTYENFDPRKRSIPLGISGRYNFSKRRITPFLNSEITFNCFTRPRYSDIKYKSTLSTAFGISFNAGNNFSGSCAFTHALLVTSEDYPVLVKGILLSISF